MYSKIISVILCLMMCTMVIPGSVVADNRVKLTGSDIETNPGEEATIEFTLSNKKSESINGAAINIISVPDGWTITDHEANGGSYKQNARQFIWLSTPKGAEQTGSITLSVPEDASGEYSVDAEAIVSGSTVDSDSGAVLVTSGQGETTPTDDSTEEKIDSELGKQGFNAALSFDDVQSIGENKVRAKVSVQNRGNKALTGPAVKIKPPEGWRITNQDSVDGTYNKNSNQWIWISIDAKSKQYFSFTMENTRNDIDPNAEIQADLIIDGETAVTTNANYQQGSVSAADDLITEDGSPGFGIIVALISMLLGVFYIKKQT